MDYDHTTVQKETLMNYERNSMAGVKPMHDTPNVDELLSDTTAKATIVPYNTILEIVGRPEIVVNESGLSLTKAVAKAMLTHTTDVIPTDETLARRIEVVDVTFRPPKIVVELFESEEARLAKYPSKN